MGEEELALVPLVIHILKSELDYLPQVIQKIQINLDIKSENQNSKILDFLFKIDLKINKIY